MRTDFALAEVNDLVRRVREGDVRALARAISLVENGSPWARQIVADCRVVPDTSIWIGITGASGAGKSTLVDQLARRYRGRDLTVGVLAMDPSSPITGGALLGDRIRLREHAVDRGVYLRSMATRGALGGLASASADVASVIAASGKQRILIETVGVGQNEVAIANVADVVLVVLVPGMGDDVQCMKAGLMEIASVFVVNKSDQEGAHRLEQEIVSMQSTACTREGWIPPVARTVATTGAGLEEVDDAVEKFLAARPRSERRGDCGTD